MIGVDDMTDEKLEKANLIKQDIERLEQCVWFFSSKQSGICNRYDRYDRDDVERAKKRRFPYLFEGFVKDDKNKARLNYHGFFGGKTIEVDDDFISMCREYFEIRLAEKKTEFEKLN